MNQAGHADKLPNYTRQMLWVFFTQMLLLVAVFIGRDFFPSWLSRIIMVMAILFPPITYLYTFTRAPIRRAWHDLLRSFWKLFISMLRAIARCFHPATIKQLFRLVTSLQTAPTTADEWITFGVLPFKTCVVITFPLIWLFNTIISHSSNFPYYSRAGGLSYQFLYECYFISLLGLLIGALLQSLFCPAGRVTVTLRFFLLGLILLFGATLFPQGVR
ncbi:MAG TPA: hypothetical protein VGO57_05020 [Verrucomicrobiae bacterium]